MGRRAIRTEIEIDAPRAEVWAVLVDWPRYGEWNPWMLSIVGKLEVGARLDVRALLGERRVGFQPTLVHVEDGRGFRWLGHTLVRGLFDGEHAFELESLGEGRTRFLHTEKFRGILAGLVLALLRKQTEAGFRAMNTALKERCETPTASVPSTA